MNERLAHIADVVSRAAGHPLSILGHVVALMAWIVSGPLFGWSDTWQLVAVTWLSIEAILLSLLILNSGARNSAATHLKLDELLRGVPEARTEMAVEHLEDATEQALTEQRAELERLAEEQP